MFKKSLVCVMFAIVSLQAFSQQFKDCVYVESGTLCEGEGLANINGYFKYRYITHRNSNEFLETFTVGYERNVFKNFWLGGDFSKWEKSLEVYEDVPISSDNDGKLWSRSWYKMAEIYAEQKIPLTKSRRNVVNICLGVTEAWGMDEYIDHVYTNPNPPYDGELYVNYKNEKFTGLLVKGGYDFYCLWNRINLGAEAAARWYPKLPYKDFNCGFHIGFNF